MPLGFNEIPRIEKANEVHANVFQFKNNGLIPFLLSKNKDCRLIMDLLLSDGQTDHYALIKDLKILSSIRQQVPRSISRICRNRFHFCSCEEVYQRFFESCFEFEAATIKMPNDENKVLNFNNYLSKWFELFVRYFDFESLIDPLDSCRNYVYYSSKEVFEVHQSFGFCLLDIELDNPKPAFIKIARSENCMETLDVLEKHGKDIYQKKQH